MNHKYIHTSFVCFLLLILLNVLQWAAERKRLAGDENKHKDIAWQQHQIEASNRRRSFLDCSKLSRQKHLSHVEV